MPHHGFTSTHWDAQFPFWEPFALADPQTGAPLRGWDGAALMEPGPDLLALALAKEIPLIRRQTFTLIYHPAHARTPTFAPDGGIHAFRGILDLAAEHGCRFATMKQVYGERAAQHG